jgi:hypothetical protein
MLFRWLIWSGFALAACSAPTGGSSSASTSVIDRPAETISTRGVDCQRVAGPQQSLVPAELLERLQDDAPRMIDDLLATVRGELQLPAELTVINDDCREQNAYYHSETKTIQLCNGLFSNVAALWFDPNRSESENHQRILGAWRFVFFHELGHALADIYDLPIVDQEDAVDDFSTLKLIEAGLAEDALSAAGFWHNKTRAAVPCTSFLDEHSLSEKRFEAIVCLVYGSDPQEHERRVAMYELTESQLCVCPLEFAKQSAHWQRLLDAAGKSAPACGYLATPCCEGSYPCQASLECVSASCAASECR